MGIEVFCIDSVVFVDLIRLIPQRLMETSGLPVIVLKEEVANGSVRRMIYALWIPFQQIGNNVFAQKTLAAARVARNPENWVLPVHPGLEKSVVSDPVSCPWNAFFSFAILLSISGGLTDGFKIVFALS